MEAGPAKESQVRCIAIREFGGPDKLEAMDLPRPRPEKNELLVRVVAAGVNPVDCRIRAGLLEDVAPRAFPLIPGWDVAGVVEELGEQATRFRKGDRIWACARKPTVQWGCYAGFVAVPESGVALMPSKLLFEEAAAFPTAGLAAWQSLSDEAFVAAGKNVLVHAAGGGVGHFAVQLACAAGARVFGTARTANHEFVLGLGAAAVIDYTREDFREALRRDCPEGIDLVLDTVGGDVQTRSLDVLRPGGRLVSLVHPPDAETGATRGISGQFLSVEPDGQQLVHLGRLVDQRRLRTNVQKIYTLAQAADAHRALEAGHVRGKLVLNL